MPDMFPFLEFVIANFQEKKYMGTVGAVSYLTWRPSFSQLYMDHEKQNYTWCSVDQVGN